MRGGMGWRWEIGEVWGGLAEVGEEVFVPDQDRVALGVVGVGGRAEGALGGLGQAYDRDDRFRAVRDDEVRVVPRRVVLGRVHFPVVRADAVAAGDDAVDRDAAAGVERDAARLPV